MAIDRQQDHVTEEQSRFKADTAVKHEEPVVNESSLNRLQQLAIEYGIPLAIVTGTVLTVAHNLHIGG